MTFHMVSHKCDDGKIIFYSYRIDFFKTDFVFKRCIQSLFSLRRVLRRNPNTNRMFRRGLRNKNHTYLCMREYLKKAFGYSWYTDHPRALQRKQGNVFNM